MHFLGIDIGHEATRVVALDLEAARLTEETTAPHAWVEGLPDDYREQDPRVWIEAVGHAVKELLEGLGEARKDVVAIGLTAPAGGMVVLDQENRIVRPAKLGSDRAAKRQVEEFGRAFGAAPGLVELTGNALDAGALGAQALWLKQHEPYHFQRAARLMSPQDFIGYWLTGEAGSSASTAATTGLFAIPKRIWCQELVEFVDSRLSEMLPAGIAPGQPRGLLRKELAAEWGLSESVLVASGSSRSAASIFAAGAALPGHVVADLSIEGALVAVSEGSLVDYRGEGSVGCDLAGNGFTRMPMNNVVAARELIRRHYGWKPEDEEQALASTQPGAGGLLFLPYLRGESVPRMIDGTGVLHGITLENFSPGNVARAAAEGVALGFGYAMSRLKELGFEPSMVRLTSDAGPQMNQLLADVFGVPVAAVSGRGGPLLGGLMQAAVAYFHQNGEQLGFDEIAGYVVTVDDETRCQPNPERHQLYQTLLARQQYLAETLHTGRLPVMVKTSEIRQSRKTTLIGNSAGWLMRAVCATLRFEIEDRCGLGDPTKLDGAVIYCLWHNRIFTVPAVWKKVCGKHRKAVVLTSASHDGAMLAKAVGVFGIGSVRGSSSRRAVAALVALRKALRQGYDACLTPDGPRGPRYEFQAGALKLAQTSGAPVIPIHVEFSDSRQLKSWDRFRIPKPFSKVKVIFDEALAVPAELSDADFEAWRVRIEGILRSGVDDFSQQA